MKMKKGFTLIELLVVISIIGLLIVFLAPKLVNVRDRAKEAGIKAVMHSVQLSVEAYNGENSTYPIATSMALYTLYDQYLKTGGYLTSLPKNPFTNADYTEKDTAGKIEYSYEASTDTYKLTGYKRDGKTKLLELSNL